MSNLPEQPTFQPPRPRTRWGLGHLPRWPYEGLGLLEEGARLGGVFDLQLWRKVTVGYRPDWNRAVLTDLDTFRSKGSLSQLSPYLSAGVVAQDNPQHRSRRRELNPTFHRTSVAPAFTETFRTINDGARPFGAFDPREWASEVVLQMLHAAFLGKDFPLAVLRSFVAPLDQDMPNPLLPRPFRLRQMHSALSTVFENPTPGTLAQHFATLDDGVEEARVALAAAYDTTAHSLTFALWELAGRPDLNDAEAIPLVVDETLRLYPSGWIGSRICTKEVEIAGVRVPEGRMVMYSPYLTHRDPQLWTDPLSFRPERFQEPRPAWGYLPFAAGERTCLGAALATLMLRTAVSAFNGSRLTRVSGNAAAKGGLTLAPAEQMQLLVTKR